MRKLLTALRKVAKEGYTKVTAQLYRSTHFAPLADLEVQTKDQLVDVFSQINRTSLTRGSPLLVWIGPNLRRARIDAAMAPLRLLVEILPSFAQVKDCNLPIYLKNEHFVWL